ncbi:MAG TPA: ABC transporter ATP-binding protein [Anaerolineae bacterium]|jgi:ABC-type branched-subunit amino acid transport system ATPase component
MTQPTNGRPLLKVEDIYAGYQGFDIIKGVSLHVSPGEIVCVIGPNGAGKSTVFKALYGFIGVRQGRVWFDGQEITALRPQEMLRVGVTMVPQLRSVFPQMTVLENLELGMFLERDRRRIRQRIAYILDLFPRLGERAKQQAGTMSGGEQRMLEIGRALMWDPRLIMMDEPSAGLAPIITGAIFKQIRCLNEELGLTILMIEQNARRGLEISDRGYVLELGQNSYQGTGQELINNEEVRRAFLGG